MKVLITGAEGMLGTDLADVFEANGYEIFDMTHEEMDIMDFDRVSEVFDLVCPDFVIHCAAYTNVDKTVDECEMAYAINVFGTQNVAQAAEDVGATLVYISTDYVFDGNKTTPYTPDDQANPINNYGLTKYKGEDVVREVCSKYYIVRTSWLYGRHGKNFVDTMLSMKDKDEIKVVDDQIGCPTWTVELSEAILKVLKNKQGGVYHICGGGSASWYEFAKEIFKLQGIKANLIPCKTEDYPRLAERPRYSVMDNAGLCKNWREGLKEYLLSRSEG